MRYWIGIVFAIGFASGGVLAQDLPRALFLVARPGMNDPNFRESVVLVTPDDAGGAIGIIINRPTDRSLASILPGDRFSHLPSLCFLADRWRRTELLPCSAPTRTRAMRFACSLVCFSRSLLQLLTNCCRGRPAPCACIPVTRAGRPARFRSRCA